MTKTNQQFNPNHREAPVALSTPGSTPVSASVSGSGMDRKVQPQTRPLKKWAIITGSLLVLLYLVYTFIMPSPGKTLAVDNQRIVISEVTTGIFEDFIPVRGQITPAQTVFLDAIEGGRVERILVEDGARLNAGELIVELSNASLQLNVLGNEARVAEQLNNIRTIELDLEQNRLQHKSNLLDINYQIKMLTRQQAKEQALLESGAVQQAQFDDTSDTLDWYKSRLALTRESQQSDAKMQGEQLAFLKETGARLEHNLAISRQNLENMKVKAPVAGKLSGFNIQVGQSIARGERLGQIDTPDNYKITAFIDEFYLGRVAIGQQARFKDYALVIAKIYPQVQNGQFKVDFTFVEQQPGDIRRGQNVQIKLTLGDASKATLVPNGSFFQDTGGNWIFVLTADGSEAIKRNIRLGRRNSRFIEVIEGLDVGEQVVTSSYASYLEMQRLKLNRP
ncbi:HlyD family efflux transporter periplasmic adaptor subunit [Thalassomonas sp. RHCl1]|uniref:efflux RND transporter periplasmic adaptor subunit n=1 Tax=Thalassomonas sp. RHCl1 TaxID=2995320 RepID=UPI00248C04B9|nr:HlyD family efflux transporter periplasmic adaptor subunit [Thalassomonas sp. RHCl1]